MEYPDDIHITTEIDFDEIYLLYYPRLLLYAIKLIGNRVECEEIIQDVFIHFWLKKNSLNVKFSIKAYLFRSVHNACFDFLKSEKVQRRKSYAVSSLLTGSVEFCDPLLLEELETAIQKSIENLPEQCQRVFLLHRYEKLTYREIARNLNISVKTVETQVSRALKIMKKSLAGYLPQIFL